MPIIGITFLVNDKEQHYILRRQSYTLNSDTCIVSFAVLLLDRTVRL